ncbi:Cuticle-degrading protease [Phlyctochytrium planicorne]|nr:Cuticle-degrading protease [Phlyctochytrium planicorne]
MTFARLAIIASLALCVASDNGYYAPAPPSVSSKKENVQTSTAPLAQPSKGPKKCIRYKKKGTLSEIYINEDGVATFGASSDPNIQLIGDGTFDPSELAPEKPAPVDPTPADPSPADPSPEEPRPADPGPVEQPKGKPSKETLCSTLMNVALSFEPRKTKADLIEQINAIRGAYGNFFGALPTVSYDDSIEEHAQAHANELLGQGCPATHSSEEQLGSFGAGENIFQIGGSVRNTDYGHHIRAMIDYVKECEDLYDMADAGLGSIDGHKKYGHLSQLLWKSSTSIGCGLCSSGQIVSICQYKSRGNIGEPMLQNPSSPPGETFISTLLTTIEDLRIQKFSLESMISHKTEKIQAYQTHLAKQSCEIEYLKSHLKECERNAAKLEEIKDNEPGSAYQTVLAQREAHLQENLFLSFPVRFPEEYARYQLLFKQYSEKKAKVEELRDDVVNIEKEIKREKAKINREISKILNENAAKAELLFAAPTPSRTKEESLDPYAYYDTTSSSEDECGDDNDSDVEPTRHVRKVARTAP